MGMESGFRPEDKGRMGKDDARDEANMMKSIMGDSRFPENHPDITPDDYNRAMLIIDEILAAPKDIEAQQTIISKAGRGALAVLGFILGPESFSAPFGVNRKILFDAIIEDPELRGAKDTISYYKKEADRIAREELEHHKND